MKKIKVTARPMMIDPATGKSYTVSQLLAMNCYFQDIITAEDCYDKFLLLEEIVEKYPETKTYNFKFEEIE
jgi:hypothetical protein